MDSSDGPLVWIVVFALFIVINFILAAFGSAIQSVSDSVLDAAAKEEKPNAQRLCQLADAPQHLIRACWFYLLLTAIPAGSVASAYEPWHRYLVQAVLVALVYILGKSLPKLVGKKYGLAFCLSSFSLVHLLIVISLPFTAVLSFIAGAIAHLIGIHPKELEDEVTEDEIMSMVNEGHEQGVLDEHEAEMIQNIFQLDDTQAQDIMTHRKNITAIDGNMNLSDAISFMVGEPNSRFPVYETNIDEILGVLHFKDAMIFHNKGEYDTWKIKDIPDLLRKVSFIPETRSIDELFRSMQAKKIQMVIVVDEYGETAGLVTMEDILEEIVGNILDEYDEDDHFVIPDGDRTWLMEGMTPLEQVREILGGTFETEDYDTLNGYLVYLLDRIPDEQDHSVISKDGWDFAIMEVKDRMIKWVRVTPHERDEEAGDEAGESASTR